MKEALATKVSGSLCPSSKCLVPCVGLLMQVNIPISVWLLGEPITRMTDRVIHPSMRPRFSLNLFSVIQAAAQKVEAVESFVLVSVLLLETTKKRQIQIQCQASACLAIGEGRCM